MLTRIRSHLTYANLMATIAMFIALGGSAYAVHKINGSLLKNRSVSAIKIKKNQLGPKEINEVKLAAKLPAVPDASKVGGIAPAALTLGRSASDGDNNCDPADASYVDCVSVSLTLPQSGRVLLVGTGGQVNVVGNPTLGSCRLQVDGAALAGSTQEAGDDVFSHSNGEDNGLATTAVTGALAAGAHTFSLACNEVDPDVTFHSTKISALMVSSG